MTNDGSEPSDLAGEVQRLRTEVLTSRVVSARALSRATRLAQIVSALSQLTDPADILDRAACVVAEQYFTDIAVFVVPTDRGFRIAAHWGLAANRLPFTIDEPPADVKRLGPSQPLVVGRVGDLEVPDWLQSSQPRHLAWGRLDAREEELGYLLLARRGDEPFEPTDVQELGLVVSRIALAVDNAHLYMRTQEQLHKLRRLHEVTAVLASTLDLDRAVRSIARTLVDEIPVVGAGVYLARDDGLELAGQAGDVGEIPVWIDGTTLPARLDARLSLLDVGGSTLGALLLFGAPPPESEATSFVEHLADLSSLVIEKSLLFERIRAQAESDTLTGLANRALLMDRLNAALAAGRHTGVDVAVIFVDLDGFKAVNDRFGHHAGDQLLVAVAARVLGVVRGSDTVARIGGDEFVVLCTDVTTPGTAARTANRIQTAIAEPFDLGPTRITVRGSVGVGLASESGYHASALLRAADTAMYADKQRVPLVVLAPR